MLNSVAKDTVYLDKCYDLDIRKVKSLKSLSTMNKNRQQVLTQATAAHQETLRRNLQHRLEVARAQGNEALVRQLEAEAAYLHLR
jgi:hypothetical protein